MAFLVQAFDGEDSEAMARRMAVREQHLAGARVLKAAGKLLYAGALLDDAGKMTGSVLVFDLPTKEEVEAALRADPYTAGGVWLRWTITPFRPAPL